MARAQKWDLGTDEVMKNFQSFVANMRLAGKRPIVQFVPERRTLDQNQMIYAVYQQIGAQCEDKSITDIRNQCKLDHGAPILCAEDPEFCKFFDAAFSGMEYERQLKAMPYVPVTSLMTKPQAMRYIDEVIREFTQQGYALAHPSIDNQRGR